MFGYVALVFLDLYLLSVLVSLQLHILYFPQRIEILGLALLLSFQIFYLHMELVFEIFSFHVYVFLFLNLVVVLILLRQKHLATLLLRVQLNFEGVAGSIINISHQRRIKGLFELL